MDDLKDVNANSSEVFNVNNSSDNFDFNVLKSSEDKGWPLINATIDNSQ